MFNPLKRLSESLAQTQEQARRERQKSQQQLSPKPLFDTTDAEESTFVNGDDNSKSPPPQTTEDSIASDRQSEDTATSTEKKEQLPKDVRIKLAKLTKYEDRHPSTWLRRRGLMSRVAGGV